jgi:hypothetical protein
MSMAEFPMALFTLAPICYENIDTKILTAIGTKQVCTVSGN